MRRDVEARAQRECAAIKRLRLPKATRAFATAFGLRKVPALLIDAEGADFIGPRTIEIGLPQQAIGHPERRFGESFGTRLFTGWCLVSRPEQQIEASIAGHFGCNAAIGSFGRQREAGLVIAAPCRRQCFGGNWFTSGACRRRQYRRQHRQA